MSKSKSANTSKSKSKTSPRKPTPKTAPKSTQSKAAQTEQTFHHYDKNTEPVKDENGTIIDFHPGYN